METRNSKEPKDEAEVKCLHPVVHNDHTRGILRSVRDVPPAHYSLKIKSWSSFLQSENEFHESRAFETGGHRWKFSLFPNGSKERNVNGHISIYLAIADPKTLPLGWEVNVNFKFFVFDHIRDIYLTVQEGGTRRFHRSKTEWGFDEFLSLDTFNNAANGYLHNDCCVFGVEVFVITRDSKGECLSTVKDPINNTFSWKVNNFATINNESLISEEFLVGEHKWKLLFYPKGNGRAKGKSLSVYLELASCETLPSETKVYAECNLRIRDQILDKHFEKKVKNWFAAVSRNWGYSDLLSLGDLNDASKGFLVKDTVIVEAEIILISTLEDF